MGDERVDSSGFDQAWEPITTSALLRLERSIWRRLTNIQDGTTLWKRQIFEDATELTINANAISAPTRLAHTLAAQSGTDDELDWIDPANGHYLLLKARNGHTISLRPGWGNITSESGARVRLIGNRTALLFGQVGGYAIVGAGDALTSYAASDPGSGDDCLDGYSEGSIWVNGTRNRVWLCTNAAAGAAAWEWISEPLNWWSGRAESGNTLTGEGAAVSVTGTSGMTMLDADGTWLPLTSAIIGTPAAAYSGALPEPGVTRWNYEFVWETRVKTGAVLTSQRLWVALIDAAGLVNADTLTNPAIALRYSSVAGDAGWRAVTRDTVGQTTGAQVGANIAANTVYRLRVRAATVGGVTIYYRVNDSAEVALTTNIPAITQNLVLHIGMYPQIAENRTLLYGVSRVAW